IMNSGVSFSKVVAPIVVLAVVLTAFHFGFNEMVAIPSTNRKNVLTEQITNSYSSSNNSDIAMSEMQNGYMVYAASYSDRDQTLYDDSLLESTEDGKLIRRTDAYKAVYDNETNLWTFHDVYIYEPMQLDDGASDIKVRSLSKQVNTVLMLEPQLFRSGTNEISRMSLDLARAYLTRMKSLNREEYAKLGTEYYKRIFSCLSPLIMVIIACSMNYRFKKNVLFISLIVSISLIVVYYVVQMMTMMMANQGVIAPQLGTLIPFAVMLLVSFLMGAFLRRQ
ncbi:MAG: LptF/LptG family permease, partial [Spirochaetales bacterium]|nr:LptF/LptG family permease [Spirochaetales bacterium]